MSIFTREDKINLYQSLGYAFHKAQSEINFVSYVHPETNERYTAVAFAGRAQKPIFHITFNSLARLEEHVSGVITNYLKQKQFKVQRQAEKKSFQHTLKVGDILYTCWGYEQTNIEFFQVTKLIGHKSVEIVEIAEISETTGYLTGNTAPLPNDFVVDAEPMVKRVREGNCIRMSSFSTASPVEYQVQNGVKVYRSYSYSSYA